MNPDTSRPSEQKKLHQAWMDRFRHEIVDTIDAQMFDTFDLLPDEYFASVSDADQLSQLKALMAIRICDIKQEIMLRSPDGRKITIIAQENYAGFLAQLIRRLPDQGDLIGAKIFSSRNGQFVVDIFEFRNGALPNQLRELSDSEIALADSIVAKTSATSVRARQFVANYQAGHEILECPDELVQQYVALEKTQDTNDLTVIWEVMNAPEANDDSTDTKRYAKVVVSSGNTTTRAIFARAAEFFAQYQINIERAFCENMRADSQHPVALLTFHVCIEKTAFDQARQQFQDDCSDVLDGDRLRTRLAHYLRVAEEVVAYQPTLQTNLATHLGDLLQAELFCAFCRLIQQAVSFRMNLELTREQVFHRLMRHESTSRALLTRFLERFSPETNENRSDDDTQQPVRLASIAAATDRAILKVFSELVEGIDHCNLQTEGRSSIAMRIPGALFANEERGETPFAIFYVFGAGFDGFHVRFRDVARGGMRLVRTRNQEHYLFESARAFDEVYRLASAQQLKNKDIAEGGAKAVVVLGPNGSPTLAGQKFVDGLLDLLIHEPRSSTELDTKLQEFLYLGPDENVANELIEWIVQRASQRGYPFPNTIMSSKPATGINHKEYGVTSEGVIVFLHRALLESGFEPTQSPFSIKMTGGPDGDVGGNAIKILIRDYGKLVRFVGIADGSGAATDPAGLDHEELLRLVNQDLGIVKFQKSCLGPEGSVTGLNNDSEIARRNHLHFDVTSDVFLPAGGRPSAINANNWRKFLGEDEVPSSKIIVEGANLFVTDEARQHLSQHGTIIVKDSSANKCGVICSSLEIISSLLLDGEQFLSIKSKYVAESLELLRQLANIEAISLFNEHHRVPDVTLPEISVLISRQIIRVADEIIRIYPEWNAEQAAMADEFIFHFLPQSLTEHVGPGLAEQIPVAYRQQLVAAILSSRIVYREGCQNIASMNSDSLQKLIAEQLVCEQRVRQMIHDVQASVLPDKERIIAILDHAGARSQRELKL